MLVMFNSSDINPPDGTGNRPSNPSEQHLFESLLAYQATIQHFANESIQYLTCKGTAPRVLVIVLQCDFLKVANADAETDRDPKSMHTRGRTLDTLGNEAAVAVPVEDPGIEFLDSFVLERCGV